MSSSKFKEIIKSLIEAIDRSIGIEHASRKFYLKAALMSKSKEARELFDWLASRKASLADDLRRQRRKIVTQSGIRSDLNPLEVNNIFQGIDVWCMNIQPDFTEKDIFKCAIANETSAYTEYQRKLTDAEHTLIKSHYINLVCQEEETIRILNDRMWNLEVSRAWEGVKAGKLAPQS